MNWCTEGKKYQFYAFGHEALAVNKLLLVEFKILAVITIKRAIFWAYSSNLKAETVFSFETSVDFYRSIRPYVPEDDTFKVTIYFKRNNRLSRKERNFTKSGQI